VGTVENLEKQPPEHWESVGYEPRRVQAPGDPPARALGDGSEPRSQCLRARSPARPQGGGQPGPEDGERPGVERQQALQPVLSGEREISRENLQMQYRVRVSACLFLTAISNVHSTYMVQTCLYTGGQDSGWTRTLSLPELARTRAAEAHSG
jgi:hypothetical protein